MWKDAHAGDPHSVYWLPKDTMMRLLCVYPTVTKLTPCKQVRKETNRCWNSRTSSWWCHKSVSTNLKCPMFLLSWVKREMRQAEKDIEFQEKDKKFSFWSSLVLFCLWFVKNIIVINGSVMCWAWLCWFKMSHGMTSLMISNNRKLYKSVAEETLLLKLFLKSDFREDLSQFP